MITTATREVKKGLNTQFQSVFSVCRNQFASFQFLQLKAKLNHYWSGPGQHNNTVCNDIIGYVSKFHIVMSVFRTI